MASKDPQLNYFQYTIWQLLTTECNQREVNRCAVGEFYTKLLDDNCQPKEDEEKKTFRRKNCPFKCAYANSTFTEYPLASLLTQM